MIQTIKCASHNGIQKYNYRACRLEVSVCCTMRAKEAVNAVVPMTSTKLRVPTPRPSGLRSKPVNWTPLTTSLGSIGICGDVSTEAVASSEYSLIRFLKLGFFGNRNDTARARKASRMPELHRYSPLLIGLVHTANGKPQESNFSPALMSRIAKR